MASGPERCGAVTASRLEALVGLAVLVIAGVFLTYMFREGQAVRVDSTYPLIAEFTSAQGLSVGTDVRMAGIRVGLVAGMEINRTTYKADVTLHIDEDIEIYEDSFASVASDGLLGGAFVDLSQGVVPVALEPGDRIIDTQGRIDLIEVLAGFAE